MTEARSFSLCLEYVANIQETLSRINMYARNLITLGQHPAEEENLHVQWKEESSEIGAVFHHPDVGATAAGRTIVFWKRSELRPTFVSSLNPLYEPLQYPLFFLAYQLDVPQSTSQESQPNRVLPTQDSDGCKVWDAWTAAERVLG